MYRFVASQLRSIPAASTNFLLSFQLG